MCGIIGYTGNRPAQEILINGLETLEYRGYDSAGVAIGASAPVKAVGPVANVQQALQQTDTTDATSGIAHTRWATHGAPTVDNAHPHTDATGQLRLVHNGIIENFRELKTQLQAAGTTDFYSDTDTEVLAKLIGYEYAQTANDSLLGALRAALAQVRGTYGLVLQYTADPQTLIVARMGSPIVLGVGQAEQFVASDPSAIIAHTKDMVFLEDGDIAVVTPNGYEITTLNGGALEPADQLVTGSHTKRRLRAFYVKRNPRSCHRHREHHAGKADPSQWPRQTRWS
jgi:glucosamine--fructose-6-phosphate aminotransferase (isomerizing)